MITSTVVDFATDAPAPGNLDVRWIHGLRSRKDESEPNFQVHAYDAHTYILRQSKTVSAEAPFLYLLFGNDRALLLDTGAGKQSEARPLRDVIDGLVAGWLAEHPRESYELVVAHTHGHNDHVAGDGQFADRPATVVVSRELTAVQAFFGFTDWPKQAVSFDLGGRMLEIVATPGHHGAAITTYDPWTGFLVTGDTVLPGRLLAFDFPAFLDSIERLVEFTDAHEVTHVMGCHIEMTREAGRDYPLGCTYQPDEPPLQMTVQQLIAIRDAARSVAEKPGAHVFDDFRIYNGPFKGYIVPMMLRGLIAKVLPTRRG